MPQPWIYDGELRHDSPMVPARDAAVLRGDGAFEVVEIRGGRPFALSAHLERLRRSGIALRISIEVEAFRHDVQRLCRMAGSDRACVRLFATQGGHRVVMLEPTPTWPAALRLAPVAHRIPPLLVGVKSLSYAGNMLARRQAVAAGADDALLYDADSEAVLEGPTSAVVWVSGRQLFAPPLSLGILDSITRRVLLAVTDIEERVLRIGELASVDALGFLGTGVDLVPVQEVLGAGAFDPDHPPLRAAAAKVRSAIDGHLPIFWGDARAGSPA